MTIQNIEYLEIILLTKLKLLFKKYPNIINIEFHINIPIDEYIINIFNGILYIPEIKEIVVLANGTILVIKTAILPYLDIYNSAEIIDSFKKINLLHIIFNIFLLYLKPI